MTPRERSERSGQPSASRDDRAESGVTGVLDCRTCGACCKNPPINLEAEFPWWVEVAEGDHLLDRPDLVKKHIVRDPDGVPHLRLAPDGRCLALRGALGTKTSCSIYTDRPTPCRTVQPGDALCRRYRYEHGMD